MRPSYFSDLEGIIEFEYIEPKTTKEACSLRSQYLEKAKIIAGGTKLLPSIKQGEITPQYLINLKSIPNLEYINSNDEEGLKIGALTTLFEISQSSLADDKAKILVEAIQQRDLGMNRTRWAYHMATIGGHLSHPVSSAEIAPPLFILGAKAVVEGVKGWKTIALEEFFDKTGGLTFQNDEVLTEIRIPKQSAEVGLVYMKGSSSSPDTHALNVAVLLQLDAKHVNIEELKIVVGGIAPYPLEAPGAEGIMKGNPIDNDLIEETAQAASKEIGEGSDPETHERLKQLIEEAIRQAVDRAIGEFALGY
jgi:carbon-monoxide dehydrogenase medium subunit